MKKLVIFSLMFVSCVACLWARNWNFSLGLGYDLQSCSQMDNFASGFGLTFGAKTTLNDKFDLFADVSGHSFGTFKQNDTKYKDNKLGFKLHFGGLRKIDIKHDVFDIEIGAGLAFARSTATSGTGENKTTYGFTNLGIALHSVATYHITESLGVFFNLDPDVYIVNWNTNGVDNTTIIHRSGKFGLGLSAKLGIAYSFDSKNSKGSKSSQSNDSPAQ